MRRVAEAPGQRDVRDRPRVRPRLLQVADAGLQAQPLDVRRAKALGDLARTQTALDLHTQGATKTRTDDGLPVAEDLQTVHRVLAEQLPEIKFAAGHSLGEFSAYVAGGAMSFALTSVRIGTPYCRAMRTLSSPAGSDEPSPSVAVYESASPSRSLKTFDGNW